MHPLSENTGVFKNAGLTKEILCFCVIKETCNYVADQWAKADVKADSRHLLGAK